MDPVMELALLQRRFPEVPVKDCGKLVKDVFCARNIDSHTYEGRLFITEKAVFFVSSYSDAKVYDVHITSGEIESVTAFHRSIIPSLEFTLTEGKEEFTNFHQLGSVVQSLSDVLPGKINEVNPYGNPVKLNRMTSVPARPHPPLSPTPPVIDPLNLKKAIPCPFFTKAGFCPRRPFCQLDHGTSTQLVLSPSSLSNTNDPLRPTTSSPLSEPAIAKLKPPHLRQSDRVTRSPTKRLHFDKDSGEREDLFGFDTGMTQSEIERLDLGKLSLKKVGGVSGVEYARSTSLPARELRFGDGGVSHSQNASQNGNETGIPDRSRSDSAINQEQESNESAVNSSHSETIDLTGSDRVKKVKEDENNPINQEQDRTNNEGASPLNGATDESVLISPELEVPKNFDFSGCSDNGPLGEALPKQKTDSNEVTNERGKTDEGVFVFTATTSSSNNPSSPDYVKSKRRPAVGGVTFNLPPEEIGRVVGEGERSKDEMAILAQQLELGGSDNDSLQGDLDIEYQSRLLASFSNESTGASGGGAATGASGGPFRNEGELLSLLGRKKGQPPPPPAPPAPRLPRVFPFTTSKSQEKEERKDSFDSSDEGSSSSPTPKPGTVTSPVVSGQKRQPCVYFLSGYCRNGSACPDFHGMDPDLDEFEYDDLAMLPIPAKLCVHSASTLGRQDINSGDKIILSPQVLMSCEQQELSYPIFFKLEHPDSGQLVYAGVLEFTSPSPEAAYLPQWMMDHLGAKEGQEMKFEHVDLPKGQFVRLQPVSSAWLGIPYDMRMAMMEFQLRNFQTLTEGTKVTLTYELNRYTLKVLECKPAKGISIVDSDLTTDIVEPADFNRYHSIIEGQAVNIGLDEPVKCQVDATNYRHFVLLSLPGQPLPSRLDVEVKSHHGDPDLFLCQSCTAPSQTRYTWCNQDVGDSLIQLSTDEKGFDINKPLYAGVVSLCEDTEFTIIFHRKDTLAAAKARHLSPGSLQSGKTLRDHKVTPPTSSAETTTQMTIQATSTPPTNHTPSLEEATPTATPPPPPGHGRCSYCGSVMPSLRLIMHERHCAQSTYKCPLCQTCIPKTAEKKHHFIAHELLVCECGQELTQLALHRHQEMDCSKRSVKCQFKWCNLSFPMDQLREHEDLCGRKKTPCPVCKEEVSMLEIAGHLEAFHSVDSSKIDWSKSLSSQAAVVSATPTLPGSCEAQQNFSCACGANFQFQDDLQVHQLTECTLRRVVADDPLAVADLRPEDIVG